MTSTLTDLDQLHGKVQQAIQIALISPSIAGFSITDLFDGHDDREAAAIKAFCEPMAAATIIRASYAGALEAIALVYAKLTVPQLVVADVQIPDSFYMRPDDITTVVALFNDTLGSGRNYEEALHAYSSYQPDVFDNTGEVATSFLVAVFAAADAIISRVPYYQGVSV